MSLTFKLKMVFSVLCFFFKPASWHLLLYRSIHFDTHFDTRSTALLKAMFHVHLLYFEHLPLQRSLHGPESQYTFTQLLSKVFLNKYNKTFSCDLTWSIMTKCIMKKNWTCYAGALELILASCFIRQFMRLIHFYSELTLNHHRVFVITSFCDHMWNLVVYCC